MIRIELPTLISKLNEQSKLALEQAASLCIERQHPEVTFEHYLDVLLGAVDLCCTYFIQQYIGSHIIVNASDTILA